MGKLLTVPLLPALGGALVRWRSPVRHERQIWHVRSRRKGGESRSEVNLGTRTLLENVPVRPKSCSRLNGPWVSHEL